MFDICVALEELATASVAIAMGLTPAFGGRPLAELSTEERRREHPPGIAEGKEKWCMTLTEPAGGTDILGANGGGGAGRGQGDGG